MSITKTKTHISVSLQNFVESVRNIVKTSSSRGKLDSKLFTLKAIELFKKLKNADLRREKKQSERK